MAKSKSVLVFLFVFLSLSAFCQKDRYMVFFRDKTGTPFNVSNPGAFLSQRAIERRLQHNFPVSEDDLPVNPEYIQGVKETGAEVYFTTRWMNGLLVQCQPDLVPAITQLPYVKAVELVGPNGSLIPNGRTRGPSRIKGTKALVTDIQLNMLGIDKMHSEGIKGQGVTIAILDAGFAGVDVASPFAHLQNRINLDVSHDFVYNSENVFQYDDHGTEVFSVIGAYEEGVFTGGAPEAMFQLYVTEEVPTEYRVEEYNWLFAAERADSAGVDIIQSSLGYYDFDGTAFDYFKSQMDGNTAVVTRAAQMAADRGIVVVVSAGNEGNVSWQIITAPADAEGVLAVASVNAEEVRSNSSSIGPTADNRLKPDVAAMGVSTSVIEPSGTVGKSSGTSFAAPLIASLAAGVKQKYPSLTNYEIMNAIRLSGSHATNPNKFVGYGVPDYPTLVSLLEAKSTDDVFAIYPNPSFMDSLVIEPRNPDEVTDCSVEFISVDGRSVFNTQVGFSRTTPAFVKSLVNFADGIYFIRITWKGSNFIYRFIKG